MKKILILCFLIIIGNQIFGVDPTFSTFGIRDNADSNQAILAGGTIAVSGTCSSVTSGYKVSNTASDGTSATLGEVYIYFYDGVPDPPTYNNYLDGGSYGISSFVSTSDTVFTFTVTLPDPLPTGTTYISIATNLTESKKTPPPTLHYGDDFQDCADLNDYPSGYYSYLSVVANTTEAPTGVSMSQRTGQSSPELTINYTLPEAGTANSVYLLVDTDSNHGSNGSEEVGTDIVTAVRIAGNNSEDSYTLHLDVSFTDTDPNVYTSGVSGTASLTDDDEYWFGIRYQDSAGADSVTTWWSSTLTWDGDTATPTMANPGHESFDNSSIYCTIGLTEAALSGSAKIRIETDNSGSPSGTEFNTLTLAAIHEGLGTDNFYINGGDLTDDVQSGDSNDDVVGYSTANTAFVNGTTYHWRFQYQDNYGNSVDYPTSGATGWHEFTYDTGCESFSVTPTAIDTTDDEVDITYTLPEDASNVWVEFFYDNGGETSRSKILLTDHNSLYSSGASRSVTLDCSDLTNDTDGDVDEITSGSNSLELGEDYHIKVSYQDLAGNTEVASSISTPDFTYTTDESTQAISTLTWSQVSSTEVNVQYTLPEEATNGSIIMYFTEDADTTSYNHRVHITGEYLSGAHNFNLTYPFVDTDDEVSSVVNGGEGNFVNLDEIHYYVVYQDKYGNAKAISTSHPTDTWDGLTNSSVPITLPTADSYHNTDFDFTYQLPEPGTDGSLKINIYSDNGVTLFTALTLDTGQNYNNISQHTITLDVSNLTGSSGVFSASDANAFVDDSDAAADYWIGLAYQDAMGNVEQQSSLTKIWYDDATLSFLAQPTAADGTDDDVTIGFNLPEEASEVFVVFQYDDGSRTRNSKNRATQTRSSVELISDYYGPGAESVTLNGSALTTAGDSDIETNGTPNTALVHNQDYWVYIEYKDKAGNTSKVSTISSSFTYNYDNITLTPTSPDADEETNADEGPVLDVDYTLPEAGQNVQILIDDDETHGTSGSEVIGNLLYIIDISGETSASAHNFNLSLPFSTSDDGGDGNQVSGLAHNNSEGYDLTDGETYYYAVRYQDSEGNAAVTSAWVSFLWDGNTETPTLTLPTDSGSDNTALTINVTFPENSPAPLTNSMKLYISDNTRNSSLRDSKNSRASTVITLQNITSGSNFEISGSNLGSDSYAPDNVHSVSGDLAGLQDGNSYDIYFGYQDDWGNAQAITATHTFTYDTSAPQITVSAPSASSAQTGDFDITYTKSEAALSGSFFIKFDNSNDLYDITLEMNDDYCGYTNQQTLSVDVSHLNLTTGVETVTGDTYLTSGQTYNIVFDYNDLLGNTAPTRTITDVSYVNDTSTDPVETLSWSQTSITEINVQYTLPEIATDGSIDIYFTETENITSWNHKVTIDGENTAEAHNFNLTYPFTTGDGEVLAVDNTGGATPEGSFANGNTIYYYVVYQDQYGNTAATSTSHPSQIWDALTNSAVSITSPVADQYYNTDFNFTYQLPEEGTDGTLKINIYSDNGITLYTALTIDSGSDYNDITQHAITLDVSNLTGSTGIFSASAANVLVDDSDAAADYWIGLAYQDAMGNAEQQSSLTKIWYDDATQNFSAQPTAADGTDDDVTIGFNLPEEASEVFVVFQYDDGEGKSAKNRTMQTKSIRNRATQTRSTVELISDYYGPGPESVTLNGSTLTTAGDSDIETNGTPNTALVHDQEYWVYIEYKDKAGNTSKISTNSLNFTYSYDNVTQTPTSPDADEETNTTEGPVLDVDYTLPEAGQNVQILIDDDDDHGTSGSEDITDVLYIINISGETSASAHNFNLSLPFSASDNGGDGNQVSALNDNNSPGYDLTDGVNYRYAVRYQDSEGNAAATSSWVTFLWDGTTQTPTLTAPSNGGSDNASLTVNVTYPENSPAPTEMTLYIADHVSRASASLTLQNISSGTNFIIAGDDLANDDIGDDNVSGASGDLTALVNNSQYDIYFGYKDDWGNAEAVTATHTFTYDTTAVAITVTAPTETNQTGDFVITYTKPEVSQSSLFKIFFDHASVPGYDATLTMNNTYCGYTTQQNLTVDVDLLSSTTGVSGVEGATELQNGETYTVRFNYTDLNGNVAPEVTKTIIYNTASANLSISLVDVDLGNPLDGDEGWVPVGCYKAETDQNTATISSFSLVRRGDNVSADFEATAFRLYESTDATFGGDNSLGDKAYTDPLTWNSGFSEVGQGSADMYYFFCVNVGSGFSESNTIGCRLTTSGVSSDASTTTNSPDTNLDSEIKYLDGYIIISGGDYGGSLAIGEDNQPIFYLEMHTNQGSSSLSSISFDLGGSSGADQFKANGFQLYSDDDATFNLGDSTPVGGSGTSYGDPLNLGSLGISVTESETYYFLTVDVDPDATEANTISASITDGSSFTSVYSNHNLSSTPLSGGVHTLPIQLSAFNFSHTGRKIILNWTTASEVNNQGFNVYRGLTSNAISNNQYIKLNNFLIAGAGTSSQPSDYEFHDVERVEYNKTYWYWIETVDFSGVTNLTDPKSYQIQYIPGQTGPIEPLVYGLGQNYPNPFNPDTDISFRLREPGEVIVDIFNVKGQLIKKVFHDVVEADKLYQTKWDGKDENGNYQPTGIYFYRLRSAKVEEYKRMLLMK